MAQAVWVLVVGATGDKQVRSPDPVVLGVTLGRGAERSSPVWIISICPRLATTWSLSCTYCFLLILSHPYLTLSLSSCRTAARLINPLDKQASASVLGTALLESLRLYSL